MLADSPVRPGIVLMTMVTSADEVDLLRRMLASADASPEIYVTVETVEAVTRIDSIARSADGLVLGSADLAATLGVDIELGSHAGRPAGDGDGLRPVRHGVRRHRQLPARRTGGARRGDHPGPGARLPRQGDGPPGRTRRDQPPPAAPDRRAGTGPPGGGGGGGGRRRDRRPGGQHGRPAVRPAGPHHGGARGRLDEPVRPRGGTA